MINTQAYHTKVLLWLIVIICHFYHNMIFIVCKESEVTLYSSGLRYQLRELSHIWCLKLASKYYSRKFVADYDKHTSLLYNGIDYHAFVCPFYHCIIFAGCKESGVIWCSTLLSNIKLKCGWLTMTNTLAYYTMIMIATAKNYCHFIHV